MSKQTITIQNACSISIKNKQLIVEQNNQFSSIPLEDIWVLILDTRAASISSYALSEIVNEGIGVMLCDSKHHPNGLLLPLGAHSRHSAIVEHQLTLSEPFKKNIWKMIVKQKISNQAKCLEISKRGDFSKVSCLVNQVNSGDTNNKEAHAAQVYFKELLPKGTRRESPWTAALDYGYSIVRAQIARSAVSYGWLVSRGVHHDNNENAFNLVDDFIEPFRPLIDLMISENEPPEELTPEYKRYLTCAHEYCMVLNDREYIMQNAIEEMFMSFKRAVIEKDYNLFVLPELITLKKKRYE